MSKKRANNNNPGVTINGCVYTDLSVLVIIGILFWVLSTSYPDSSNRNEPWTQFWQSLFYFDRKRTLIMVKLHDDKPFPAAPAVDLYLLRRQWQIPAKGEDVFNIYGCSKRGGEARRATRCWDFKAPNPQQAAAASVFSAWKIRAIRAVKKRLWKCVETHHTITTQIRHQKFT